MPPARKRQPAAPSVLFATSECAPLVKTGGLADVSGALPAALRALGLDVRVLLPGYRPVREALAGAAEAARMKILGHDTKLLETTLPGGVPVYVVDCPVLYDRGGGPYQADDGDDWDDNAIRFAVLSKAAALLGSTASRVDWRPDVVHCNDWQTALAAVYLRYTEGEHAASLLTLHNLAFQGIFDAEAAEDLDLPAESLGKEGLAYWGRISLLRGGLQYADAINAVSPTYAREIQGEELGFGMDDVLRRRSDRLYGVLNGIDTELWNPQTDPFIPSKYGALTLERKRPNKLALQKRMELTVGGQQMLFGMVTRITHQKGADLVAQAAAAIAKLPAQLAVVGTGDREMIEKLRAAAAAAPGKVAFVAAFDEALAHLVEAGADAFLMPSRFEPCGMNQMYSQRYGTPPIANATGGLLDTVYDEFWSPASTVAGSGVVHELTRPTGFLMKEATTEELLEAAGRAYSAWKDSRQWKALQLNGMARDFGWGPAALAYRDIYAGLKASASAPSRSGG